MEKDLYEFGWCYAMSTVLRDYVDEPVIQELFIENGFKNYFPHDGRWPWTGKAEHEILFLYFLDESYR